MCVNTSGMMQGRPSVVDEADLLASWRAGDAAAGQRLFHQFYKVVSRYFRNKIGEAARGDLVQKTFLACVRSAAQFRGASSFRTYLLQVAHHTLVDHYRAARRDTARALGHGLDLDDEVVADALAAPDVVATRRQEHEILQAALRRLPPALQVVLELRYWEALTDREIAEVLGMPLGTVKTRLRDGHLRLRDDLARPRVAGAASVREGRPGSGARRVRRISRRVDDRAVLESSGKLTRKVPVMSSF